MWSSWLCEPRQRCYLWQDHTIIALHTFDSNVIIWFTFGESSDLSSPSPSGPLFDQWGNITVTQNKAFPNSSFRWSSILRSVRTCRRVPSVWPKRNSSLCHLTAFRQVPLIVWQECFNGEVSTVPNGTAWARIPSPCWGTALYYEFYLTTKRL